MDSVDLGPMNSARFGRPVGALHALCHRVDDLHACDDPAEGREALPVGIARATEIQRRLLADANEKFAACRAHFRAGH